MTPPPIIGLTDEQMDAVLRAAEPIDPSRRGAFLYQEIDGELWARRASACQPDSAAIARTSAAPLSGLCLARCQTSSMRK
jgi:hypothetical protein